MSTDDLTAEDEQLQLLVEERENRRQLALKEYTTWNPMAEDEVHRIATGQITRLQPTVWEREDGQWAAYPGRTHLFAGPTESCKTWAALEVMAQELHAGNAVLYVDIEDEAITAIERLRELGMTADVLTARFLYCNPTEGFNSVEQLPATRRIKCRARARPSDDLAVPDSVTGGIALKSLDPDRGTDVAAFYELAPAWLASGRLAVVIIDHVPKATKRGSARTAIGSERKRSGLTDPATRSARSRSSVEDAPASWRSPSTRTVPAPSAALRLRRQGGRDFGPRVPRRGRRGRHHADDPHGHRPEGCAG